MASGKRTLLVSGASGHLGRRAVELLLEAKAGTIVATTRTPEKLKDLAARGVVVKQADFENTAAMVAALQGVDRMLLISTDALDRPGRRLEQHRAGIDAAVKAGVRHVVYTSLVNPGADSPITIAPDHRGTEEALASTTLSYTVLRNNLYADYLLNSLPRAVATGALVAAAGAGAISYVTREDCARAAAAALASDRTDRATLDITGPAGVSHEQLAKLATELTGRKVAYQPIPAEALRAGLAQAGLPPMIADMLVSFDVAAAQGKLSVVSNAVQELTGRAPSSVAEYLQGQRAALTAQ
ncbi:MAG: SDR family oxidoreductase [Myxococcota bacterium]